MQGCARLSTANSGPCPPLRLRMCSTMIFHCDWNTSIHCKYNLPCPAWKKSVMFSTNLVCRIEILIHTEEYLKCQMNMFKYSYVSCRNTVIFQAMWNWIVDSWSSLMNSGLLETSGKSPESIRFRIILSLIFLTDRLPDSGSNKENRILRRCNSELKKCKHVPCRMSIKATTYGVPCRDVCAIRRRKREHNLRMTQFQHALNAMSLHRITS